MIMHTVLIYIQTLLFKGTIKANSNNIMTDSEYEIEVIG